MAKSILLTGSNGLLGQKIVHRLAGLPHINLLAVGRGVNRHPLRAGYAYQNVNLTNSEELNALFDSFKPQYVIHTAAMTQVDACETKRDLCDAINVDAVKDIIACCEKYKSHLVHISTDFIFDGASGPYQETDTPNPVNYYGVSKLKAEQALLESNISFAILRTMLLYGVTPGMSRSNILLWAKKSLEEGQTIRVVNDQVRCPTLAEDLANASISAVMREAKGIFHISGAELMTIHDLVLRIAKFWKLNEELVQTTTSDALNQAARRPPRTGFILLKAQTQLDYRPHSLEQGFAQVDRQLSELAVEI
ncbi:MAG: SDR family oxidoreductase [Bacteroidota bacterium]